MNILKKSITQLTAPGDSTTVDLRNKLFSGGVCKATVADVDTNVVLRVEYSNTSNFAAEVWGEIKTITADGVHALVLAPGYHYARLVFVSESGGTAATVDATFEIIK